MDDSQINTDHQDSLPIIKGKEPAQVAQAISMLAAGMSTRQIAKVMGKGWSQSRVVAFRNKADVKVLVEKASRALMSRALLPAIENQALKIEAAGNQLDKAAQLNIKAADLRIQAADLDPSWPEQRDMLCQADKLEASARNILKEAYGILKLSDQAEARMLETVGITPSRAASPMMTFINAPESQVVVHPAVLDLLGQAQSSNLGQLLGGAGDDDGPDVRDVIDAEYEEIGDPEVTQDSD